LYLHNIIVESCVIPYITCEEYLTAGQRATIASYISSSSLTLFALRMDGISTSETPVLIRATRRHIPEDGILHGFMHVPCEERTGFTSKHEVTYVVCALRY
jgi:hypothetical protein